MRLELQGAAVPDKTTGEMIFTGTTSELERQVEFIGIQGLLLHRHGLGAKAMFYINPAGVHQQGQQPPPGILAYVTGRAAQGRGLAVMIVLGTLAPRAAALLGLLGLLAGRIGGKHASLGQPGHDGRNLAVKGIRQPIGETPVRRNRNQVEFL